MSARKLYIDNFNTDIIRSLYIPSLSLLIFRHKFLSTTIDIPKKEYDTIIRPVDLLIIILNMVLTLNITILTHFIHLP